MRRRACVFRRATGTRDDSIHGRGMNIFALSWFLRGLRGHSITFSLLFAALVLGFSLSGELKHLLGSLGVHWLYVLVLPGLFFAWLNRMEPRWLPDQTQRRRIARALLFGSLAVAVLIAWLR